jgi:outer membrane protein OmpA-like peptidoglycan-associated protein
MRKAFVFLIFVIVMGFSAGCVKPKKVTLTPEFIGPTEEAYIALSEDDLYDKLAIGDPEALRGITAYSSIPQSRLEPGEGTHGIPGIDGFKDPKAMNLAGVFEMVHFDTNDYVVRGQSNRDIIRKIAQYLKQHPSLCVFVEGHCDERGTAAYNMSLGAKRSNSVRALLVKEGASLESLFTISYGKENPLSLSKGEESWKQNRRTQYKLFDRDVR